MNVLLYGRLVFDGETAADPSGGGDDDDEDPARRTTIAIVSVEACFLGPCTRSQDARWDYPTQRGMSADWGAREEDGAAARAVLMYPELQAARRAARGRCANLARGPTRGRPACIEGGCRYARRVATAGATAAGLGAEAPATAELAAAGNASARPPCSSSAFVALAPVGGAVVVGDGEERTRVRVQSLARRWMHWQRRPRDGHDRGAAGKSPTVQRRRCCWIWRGHRGDLTGMTRSGRTTAWARKDGGRVSGIDRRGRRQRRRG